MRLELGLCYVVLLTDGSVVSFQFHGQGENGTVLAESPPGSGAMKDLGKILQHGFRAYWEIDCP